MATLFSINGHTYDFTNCHPKLDGVLIAKKDDMIKMFYQLLQDVGYTFDPALRPVPAMLLNAKSVHFKYLRKWMFLCISQIVVTPPELLKMSVLDLDGFSLKDQRTSQMFRLVRLDLQSDEYNRSCTVSFDNLASIINRFMANEAFHNKKCIVQ